MSSEEWNLSKYTPIGEDKEEILKDKLVSDLKGNRHYYGFALSSRDKRSKEWREERDKFGIDSTEMWNLDNTIICYLLDSISDYQINQAPFDFKTANLLKIQLNYLHNLVLDKNNLFFTDPDCDVEREIFETLYWNFPKLMSKVAAFAKPRITWYVEDCPFTFKDKVSKYKFEIDYFLDQLINQVEYKNVENKKAFLKGYLFFIRNFRAFWW